MFVGDADFRHGAASRIGVLLINLGTPNAPNAAALRVYLRQFLSDRRVVEAPRWWWLPLLWGVIVPRRAPKSAAKYRAVWSAAGSPLLAISKAQCRLLQARFDKAAGGAGDGGGAARAMEIKQSPQSDSSAAMRSAESPPFTSPPQAGGTEGPSGLSRTPTRFTSSPQAGGSEGGRGGGAGDGESAGNDGGAEAAPVCVALGMRYGKPSIESALDELLARECRHIAALPLYPQYAAACGGSAFDALADALKRRRRVPHLHFIADYCDHPGYIAAIAESVADYRRQNGGADKLIFSFHGTPLSSLLAGDPYHCHCRKTARLIAEKLGLKDDEWITAFQSRFGKAEWLQPYTDATIRRLAEDGAESVQVVCPGFAADCLETLEEIADENREIFLTAGGKRFGYIPALNASGAHIDLIYQITAAAIAPWRAKVAAANDADALEAQQARAASSVRIPSGSANKVK